MAAAPPVGTIVTSSAPLVTGFVLGFVFNATPGPVFAQTVRQGVRGGFRAALAVQIGSLAGDFVWAVVGLAGAGLLLRLEPLRTPISIASGVYLLWLARGAWLASRAEFAVPAISDEVDQRRALRSGILLSLTNAQNVAFWAAIGGALAASDVKAPTFFDNVVFFAGFMASSALWAFVVAALVDRVFRRATVRWARLTYRACAIAFLMLAMSMLRQFWGARQQGVAVPAPSSIAGVP
jgi:chemosensory pili system protein ChpE